MLPREFHDPLAIWPAVAWPIIFASAFLGFLRLCMIGRNRYGFSAISGSGGAVLLVRAYALLGMVFELLMHFYLLKVIGSVYAMAAVPIAVLGWLALPMLLDEIGPGQLLLSAIHFTVAASFIVLLGFADIGVLRVLNSELYALLTGVEVRL